MYEVSLFSKKVNRFENEHTIMMITTCILDV